MTQSYTLEVKRFTPTDPRRAMNDYLTQES
jgi:hypothetical protein